MFKVCTLSRNVWVDGRLRAKSKRATLGVPTWGSGHRTLSRSVAAHRVYGPGLGFRGPGFRNLAFRDPER